MNQSRASVSPPLLQYYNPSQNRVTARLRFDNYFRLVFVLWVVTLLCEVTFLVLSQISHRFSLSDNASSFLFSMCELLLFAGAICILGTSFTICSYFARQIERRAAVWTEILVPGLVLLAMMASNLVLGYVFWTVMSRP